MKKRQITEAEDLEITKIDCLMRLKDCLQRADFSHVLTDNEREQMEYNLQIIAAFVPLNDVKDDIRTVNAIGFDISEDEDEDEEDDEDEDEDG